jgi:hypothetical protein
MKNWVLFLGLSLGLLLGRAPLAQAQAPLLNCNQMLLNGELVKCSDNKIQVEVIAKAPTILDELLWWHLYRIGFFGPSTIGLSPPDSSVFIPSVSARDVNPGESANGMTCGPKVESCSMVSVSDRGRLTRSMLVRSNPRKLIKDRSMVNFSQQISNKVYENIKDLETPLALAAVTSVGAIATSSGIGISSVAINAATIARITALSSVLPTSVSRIPMYLANFAFKVDVEKIAMGMQLAMGDVPRACAPRACYGGVQAVKRGYDATIISVKGIRRNGESSRHAVLAIKNPARGDYAVLTWGKVFYGNTIDEAMEASVRHHFPGGVVNYTRYTVSEYVQIARGRGWKFIDFISESTEP